MLWYHNLFMHASTHARYVNVSMGACAYMQTLALLTASNECTYKHADICTHMFVCIYIYVYTYVQADRRIM